MADRTNREVIKARATVPQEDIVNLRDKGDVTRKHLLNPAIFKALGEVRGKTLLDLTPRYAENRTEGKRAREAKEVPIRRCTYTPQSAWEGK